MREHRAAGPPHILSLAGMRSLSSQSRAPKRALTFDTSLATDSGAWPPAHRPHCAVARRVDGAKAQQVPVYLYDDRYK